MVPEIRRRSSLLSSRTQKAQLAFINMRHLWPSWDIRLRCNGNIGSAMRFRNTTVLGSRCEYRRCLNISVFAISLEYGGGFPVNSDVMRRDYNYGVALIKQPLDLNRLRWLSCVAHTCMSTFSIYALLRGAQWFKGRSE